MTPDPIEKLPSAMAHPISGNRCFLVPEDQFIALRAKCAEVERLKGVLARMWKIQPEDVGLYLSDLTELKQEISQLTTALETERAKSESLSNTLKILDTPQRAELLKRLREADWLISNCKGERSDKTGEWFERQENYINTYLNPQ